MIEKKALFFILNGLGGAERVSIEILKMLVKDGWHIEICLICTKSTIDTERMQSFIPDGIPISKLVLGNEFSILHKMWNVIHSCKPNVVFCSAMHINQRLLLLSPFVNKVKFIVRNENYLYTISRWKRLTLALTYRLAKGIICQTEEMEEELIGLGLKSDKIRTLYNPIDIDKILTLSKQGSPFTDNVKTRYVAIGRLAKQKGFDFLVKAYAKVEKLNPDSKLYIIGDTTYNNGEVCASLSILINELGLKDKVVFTGFQSNPYKYTANSDVFVLSSRYEGLPNALIEAQLLGTPAAAFKCIPIIERIVKEGENGYLAEKGNIDSLAMAMLKASELGKVKITYTPSKAEDFVNMFNNEIKN